MNDVFANGMGIAGKAGSGQSPAAFPDVCFTPPENPATPPGVPVPYPNTGTESDTTEGSRTVVIHDQEVMLKNKSYYKQSMGDEAGCAAKKGVVSSVNRGKVYFVAWSMDVQFEGANVDRHLDLTTHNHNPTPNTPPFPDLSTLMVGRSDCESILAKEGINVHRHGNKNCPPKQESDHILQNANFVNSRKLNNPISTAPDYSIRDAPCICLKGGMQKKGSPHYKKSIAQTGLDKEFRDEGYKNVAYSEVRDKNLVMIEENADPKPSKNAMKCIKLIVDHYFKDYLGLDEDTPVRVPRTRKFRINRKTKS